MRRLRYFVTVICVLVGSAGAYAQVDAQLTQYYEVPSYYNAAAIGNTDFVRLRTASRMQWVGVHGAPVTFLFTGDMPVKLLGKRIGLGLMAQQETIGLYDNLNIGAQIAYKTGLLGGTLSIGLQFGFLNQGFKGSGVVLPDDDDYHQGSDEAIPTTDLNGTAFDIAAGVYYNRRNFWAGLSMTHINRPVVSFSSDTDQNALYEFQAGRVLYFMTGGNIPINNTLFEIQPSLLVKSDFTFTTGEVTGRVRYNRIFTAGLGYRYKDAVSVLLGVEIKDFYLGYSYDYPTSALSRVSNGSHEVMAGYRLKLDMREKNRHKHKSIRIM